MPVIADPEKLLAKLVAFDTTSRNANRALIDFVRDYLDGFGIKSELVASDDGTKACLFATIGSGAEGGLVLAGHTDTVPVEGQDWTSDPFTLAERDGKLYARGSADMKGFIACALSVAGEYAKRSFARPVHLAFTHDEETDMAGAQRLTDYLKKRGVKPSWAWVGEPTGLSIVDTHKGVAAFLTSITGVAGHSGQPDKGLNAISIGGRFIDILERVAAARRNNPVAGSRFAPPYTTFNLATIKGGTAENIIAGHCDILWQARAHPGDDLGAARGEIDRLIGEEIVPRLRPFAPQAKIETCTCFDIPPLLPSANNPGRQVLARLTGRDETEAVSFATEGGFFQQLGAGVVVCGPGHIDQAHKADEYIEKSQLAAGRELLRRALAEAAGTGP